MPKKKGAFLQIPQGTESLHLEEALKHRKIVKQLETLYGAWGYLPVKTPVFDFFDIYQSLFPFESLNSIYRFIDREGDLLMLRSDATLFLAKQLGNILKDSDLPLRVYYADTILRHQDKEDISNNEFFQTGAELIGIPGLSGDMEVLTLMVTTLQELKLDSACLHIGSRRLFNSLISLKEENNTYTDIQNKLQDALKYREREEIISAFTETGYDKNTAKQFADILLFIGTPEDYQAFLNKAKAEKNVPAEAEAALTHLSAVSEQLKTVFPQQQIRIDLSEIGAQPYYSGIAFQVYLEGVATSIASGGRYDELLDFFGYRAPAVGFSLLQRKAEDKIHFEEPEKKPETIEVKPDNFAEAYKKAVKMRNEGKTVVFNHKRKS